MQGLTCSQLCQLPDDEQLLSERIAIICEGEKCGEDEARAIIEQQQLELWQDHRKG